MSTGKSKNNSGRSSGSTLRQQGNEENANASFDGFHDLETGSKSKESDGGQKGKEGKNEGGERK